MVPATAQQVRLRATEADTEPVRAMVPVTATAQVRGLALGMVVPAMAALPITAESAMAALPITAALVALQQTLSAPR